MKFELVPYELVLNVSFECLCFLILNRIKKTKT